MSEHWYDEAVIYCVDVDLFADSNGDGIGDFRGLIGRLDYLYRLGVTCLWLNPIHPTPQRDEGYDVADYYNVDPRLGNLGDFAELLHQASNRGIRVIIDLVVNHTSDQHPWFVDACTSVDSPYRDWYVWADSAPPDRYQGIVFPHEQTETWTYNRKAKAWYYHRFYDFQPDLNIANPRVRAEIKKIMGFWLQLGVAERHDSSSLLAWFERMLRTLRESPEIGSGSCTPIDKAFPPGVLAHRADDHSGSMLFLHNLAEAPAKIDLGELDEEADHPNQVFGDTAYDEQTDLSSLEINGYGYRWIRLNRGRG